MPAGYPPAANPGIHYPVLALPPHSACAVSSIPTVAAGGAALASAVGHGPAPDPVYGAPAPAAAATSPDARKRPKPAIPSARSEFDSIAWPRGAAEKNPAHPPAISDIELKPGAGDWTRRLARVFRPKSVHGPCLGLQLFVSLLVTRSLHHSNPAGKGANTRAKWSFQALLS